LTDLVVRLFAVFSLAAHFLGGKNLHFGDKKNDLTKAPKDLRQSDFINSFPLDGQAAGCDLEPSGRWIMGICHWQE
jgi:hypothetical protein